MPHLQPRILVYDLETAPSLGWYFDRFREGNIIKGEADWYVLCFAWKWLGEKTTHVVGLPDFDLYDTDPANDLEVVRKLHEVFSEADVTVTHNGKNFDNKKANSRFLVHGLDPPPPRKEIDTLQVARRVFGFSSNSLADLCAVLGLPAKGDPGGKRTWFDCMAGDPRAWERMMRYNRRDVICLEKLYLKFRPWVQHHPNLAVISDRPEVCPKCNKRSRMTAHGWLPNSVSRRRRYQCQSCGGWSLGSQSERVRPQFV